MSARRIRIALYSPGIVGLGHLRRNLVISQVLAQSRLQSVNLMITEAREATAYINSLPPGMDCLTLPGLSKGVDGICRPRYLDMTLKEIIALRARTIRAALKQFKPDLFIADNLPRGAYRELDPALKCLKANGHTRCILGLRDVLDDSWSVYRDWFRWKNEEAILEHYDAIWVYGDPTIFNMIDEYRFPEKICSRIHFAGYLDQRKRLAFTNGDGAAALAEFSLPPGRIMLCLVGGGQDGEALADAFSKAEFPADACGVIVTGPFMSEAFRAQLDARAAANPQLRILKFIAEPTHLVGKADRVIAMGGYNTVCEVLSFEKPALIVPRVKPRREQIIRAERLRDLNLIHLLEIQNLSARAISDWIAREVEPPKVANRIDFNGLERLPDMAEEVLALPRAKSAAA